MAVPHFRYPFRVTGSSVAVVEQDTYDEVAQSVQMILTTEKGSRLSAPEFGIDDPVFSVASQSREQQMLEAVNRWDDRANATIHITVDNVDEFMHRVRVEIPSRPEDLSGSIMPQPSVISEDDDDPDGFGEGGFGEGGFGS